MDLEKQSKVEERKPKLPHEAFFEFVGLDIDVALPEAETVRERETTSE